MRFLSAAFVALMFVSSPVAADCVGSDTYKTCYDSETGNRYTITKYGNTTKMRGQNNRTGSNWNQRSRTIGSTTYHSGRAADGDTWRSTERRIGNARFIRGHDSDGNHFSETIFDNEYGGSSGLDSKNGIGDLYESESQDILGGSSDSIYDGLGGNSGSLYDDGLDPLGSDSDSLYDDSLYDDDW